MDTYIALQGEALQKALRSAAFHAPSLLNAVWGRREAHNPLPASARYVMRAESLGDVEATLLRRYPSDNKLRLIRITHTAGVFELCHPYTWMPDLTSADLLDRPTGARLHVVTVAALHLETSGGIKAVNPVQQGATRFPPGWVVREATDCTTFLPEHQHSRALCFHTLEFNPRAYARAASQQERAQAADLREQARQAGLLANMQLLGGGSGGNFGIATVLRRLLGGYSPLVAYVQVRADSERLRAQSAVWRSVKGGLTTLYELQRTIQVEAEMVRASIALLRSRRVRMAVDAGLYRAEWEVRSAGVGYAYENTDVRLLALDLAVKNPAAVLDVASAGALSAGRGTKQDIAQARDILCAARADARKLKKRLEVYVQLVEDMRAKLKKGTDGDPQ